MLPDDPEEDAPPGASDAARAAPEDPRDTAPGEPFGPVISEDPSQQLARRELLQRRLGYVFRDPDLLETALTHKSHANEQPEGGADNERLEFLGDAVFSLVAGHLLMHRYPDLDEGVLSKARAALVSTGALAELAATLELGGAILLGKGEDRTGGRTKPTILADALEATAAAIFLDGGFDAALAVLSGLLGPRLEPALLDLRRRDPKTHLQERIQALTKRPPRYLLRGTSGPLHDLCFIVALQAGERILAQGEGHTKKEAEQDAASRVLDRLRAGETLEALLGLSDC